MRVSLNRNDSRYLNEIIYNYYADGGSWAVLFEISERLPQVSADLIRSRAKRMGVGLSDPALKQINRENRNRGRGLA